MTLTTEGRSGGAAKTATGRKKRVVQTTLTTEEYRALIETLGRRRLSIQDGLHDAAMKLIEEESKVDANDSFFKIKSPERGSRLRDLSSSHDKYLYRRSRV